MKTVEPAKLKQVVHEVIGTIDNTMLLNDVSSIFDATAKNHHAQKQACDKVSMLVGLFIGNDQALNLEKRFQEMLN